MKPIAYTTAETAKILKIGKTRLYQLLNSGRLPSRRFGGRILILHADLQQYLYDLPLRNSNKVTLLETKGGHDA